MLHWGPASIRHWTGAIPSPGDHLTSAAPRAHGEKPLAWRSAALRALQAGGCPQAGAGDREGDVWSLRWFLSLCHPPGWAGLTRTEMIHLPLCFRCHRSQLCQQGLSPPRALQEICQPGRAARHPQLVLFWGVVRDDGCCKRCTPTLLPHSSVSQPHPTCHGKQDVVPPRAAGTPPLGNKSLSLES